MVLLIYLFPWIPEAGSPKVEVREVLLHHSAGELRLRFGIPLGRCPQMPYSFCTAGREERAPLEAPGRIAPSNPLTQSAVFP